MWIHGGAYSTGAASEDMYCGKAFAKNGVCFVSIQYRLNVLSFYDFSGFKGCEDFETNCGLYDQLCALKWIRENIASFGGDPENITLAGESAGSASVMN